MLIHSFGIDDVDANANVGIIAVAETWSSKVPSDMTYKAYGLQR